MTTRFITGLSVALLAAPSLVQSQQAAFDFSIKNMMRGPELYGREPQGVRWSADSKWIYFNWLEPGSDWRLQPKPFRVRAVAGAKPERVTAAQMDSVAPLLDAGRPSPDGKARVVSAGGDLYLVDAGGEHVRRLTQTLEAETNPVFSHDGREIYFIRDNNAYALTVDGDMSTNDSVFALANGAAGNRPIEAPSADFDAFSLALGDV